MGSSLGIEITRETRSVDTKLPKEIYEIIIGLILGDGSFSKNSTSVNACLIHTQGFVHFSYSWHKIFFVEKKLLAFLCQSTPDLASSKRNGKVHYNLRGNTEGV